jgi:hypothetical protein
MKGWKINQDNGLIKQAAVAILTSDKLDFKPKSVRRDKRSLHTNKRSNTTIGKNNH